MRRLFLFMVLLGAVAATQVGGASGSRENTQWVPFHVHMNAYAHWGHCTDLKYGGDARWQDSGRCDGTLEAGHLGTIVDYSKYHSNKVHWTWHYANGDVRTFKLEIKPDTLGILHGHMPYNWHTFTVTGAAIKGWNWVTGTTAGKGEPGGPLYVDLSSHQYLGGDIIHYGYSLDLRGYLKIHR